MLIVYLPAFLWKKPLITINDLFLTTDKVHNFEREELKQLLTFAAYESFLIFDGEYYSQIDAAAMGSPLGPTLANAFLCHFEKK